MPIRKNGGFMQEIILIKDEIPWDKEGLWKIIHLTKFLD